MINLNDAIKKVEIASNKKVLKYCMVNGIYIFIVKTNPKYIQNGYYIVKPDGKVELTVPMLIEDFDSLIFKSI